MPRSLKVGIIGDFDPNYPSHIATNEALAHAAGALSVILDCSWLPTQVLDETFSEATLRQFDALWCSSGGPYSA